MDQAKKELQLQTHNVSECTRLAMLMWENNYMQLNAYLTWLVQT